MPIKLTTTISKIVNIPNNTNSILIKEFYEYKVKNDTSERNQNNYLKAIIPFGMFLGPGYDLLRYSKNRIIEFLNTKIKSRRRSDKKWITPGTITLSELNTFLDGFIIIKEE